MDDLIYQHNIRELQEQLQNAYIRINELKQENTYLNTELGNIYEELAGEDI